MEVHAHLHGNMREEAFVLTRGIWEYFPEEEESELDFIRQMSGGWVAVKDPGRGSSWGKGGKSRVPGAQEGEEEEADAGVTGSKER